MRSADADHVALLDRLKMLQSRETELGNMPEEEKVHLVSTGKTYREAWVAAETVEERRNLLTKAITQITIGKGVKGRTGPIDPDRVSIDWETIKVQTSKSKVVLGKIVSNLDDLYGAGILSVGNETEFTPFFDHSGRGAKGG